MGLARTINQKDKSMVDKGINSHYDIHEKMGVLLSKVIWLEKFTRFFFSFEKVSSLIILNIISVSCWFVGILA